MIKAYYADICNLPDPCGEDILQNIGSAVRREYLFSVKARKRLKQSYYLWLLLQGICEEFKLDSSLFIRNKKGNWFSPSTGYNFSFSHSGNIVFVVISDMNVGADVELISDRIIKFKNKISGNGSVCSAEELTEIWTEKESEYKRGGHACFITGKITDSQKNEYCVCVCTNENRVKFIQKML